MKYYQPPCVSKKGRGKRNKHDERSESNHRRFKQREVSVTYREESALVLQEERGPSKKTQKKKISAGQRLANEG